MTNDNVDIRGSPKLKKNASCLRIFLLGGYGGIQTYLRSLEDNNKNISQISNFRQIYIIRVLCYAKLEKRLKNIYSVKN